MADFGDLIMGLDGRIRGKHCDFVALRDLITPQIRKKKSANLRETFLEAELVSKKSLPADLADFIIRIMDLILKTLRLCVFAR